MYTTYQGDIIFSTVISDVLKILHHLKSVTVRHLTESPVSYLFVPLSTEEEYGDVVKLGDETAEHNIRHLDDEGDDLEELDDHGGNLVNTVGGGHLLDPLENSRLI